MVDLLIGFVAEMAFFQEKYLKNIYKSEFLNPYLEWISIMAKKQAQKELLQNTIQHENPYNFTIIKIKIKTFFKKQRFDK